MWLNRLILGVTLATMPAALGAQQGDPAARIEAAMGAAARAEIPVSLLQSKVQEGRAKGIAEVRIATAVEARLAALLHAHGALARGGAGSVNAGDLSVAADAIQAGVAEAAMVDVMTRVPAPRRAVATAVLTELVEMGVASDVALSQVHAAISQGGEALVNLPSQVTERGRGQNQGQGQGRGRIRDVAPPVEVEAGVRGGGGVGQGRGNHPND